MGTKRRNSGKYGRDRERNASIEIYYEVCSGCGRARQVIAGSFIGDWKKDMNTNGLSVKLVSCGICGPGSMHAAYGHRRSKISAHAH